MSLCLSVVAASLCVVCALMVGKYFCCDFFVARFVFVLFVFGLQFFSLFCFFFGFLFCFWLHFFSLLFSMPQDQRQRGARYVYAMCEACGASARGKREEKRGVKRGGEQVEG